MGLLIEGQWRDQWYESSKDGAFQREQAQRRNWLTADGQPGPSGDGGFAAEPGRYHLYVSLACPWAHRTLIFRKLKGLESLVDVSVVSWLMRESGWTFDPAKGSTGDKLDHLDFLHQRYTRDDPNYTGRVTVPLLWDRQRECIVNNESSEIIRMFNSAFDELTGNGLDFYPEPLRPVIDELNERIYPHINNGVYRAGFATSQGAYEEAFDELFKELDRLEQLLDKRRYLAGEYLTEADWRLFTTLIRFDAVYFGHFKCNLRRIADYPNLSNWICELYQWPGVAETVSFEHIKHHYYGSHQTINPTGIVPKGPQQNFTAPHDRERLTGKGIWGHYLKLESCICGSKACPR
ncbi:glutathione S-transferase family protein [Pseudomonas sp. R5(2019)]|uniref:glutathione S-transferase family protein n=1 Tax=Pseudomonas sp. R5(2019) TaxID=2697566 RepID=UPI001411D0B4|nr:glutathione S-transferase family protein [Pseudomonas sp. R5(2019)]NBA96802.1 glutathione S-transferase family protein [Pseudomonas sp. R5(2019)]